MILSFIWKHLKTVLNAYVESIISEKPRKTDKGKKPQITVEQDGLTVRPNNRYGKRTSGKIYVKKRNRLFGNKRW